jgi:hypothetical protein
MAASRTARLSTLVTPAGMQIITLGLNMLNRPVDFAMNALSMASVTR